MASFFLRLDNYLSFGNAWLQVKRGRFSEGADQGTSRRVKIEQVLAISGRYVKFGNARDIQLPDCKTEVTSSVTHKLREADARECVLAT